MSGRPPIRAGGHGDLPALEALYRAAFPAEDLVPLVGRLLREEPAVLSLVATVEGGIVGHLLLSPSAVGDRPGAAALLGPLAVLPARQRRGVGRALVGEALRLAAAGGVLRVLVLGDPGYYGRLGFAPERAVTAPYPLPAAWLDAWQSIDLGASAVALRGPLLPPRPWLDPALWSPASPTARAS